MFPSTLATLAVSIVSSLSSSLLLSRCNRSVLTLLVVLFGGAGMGPGLAAAEIVFTHLATGDRHSCALTNDGGVKCWGSNGAGQLGEGSTTTRTTPVAVSGLASGVIAIAAGLAHTCALTSSGEVKCWGFSAYGELGEESLANHTTPVTVGGLDGVTAIAAGNDHTCALTTGGGVKCWGRNDNGQLGDASPALSRVTPVHVNGLGSGVSAIASGC